MNFSELSAQPAIIYPSAQMRPSRRDERLRTGIFDFSTVPIVSTAAIRLWADRRTVTMKNGLKRIALSLAGFVMMLPSRLQHLHDASRPHLLRRVAGELVCYRPYFFRNTNCRNANSSRTLPGCCIHNAHLRSLICNLSRGTVTEEVPA